MSGVEAANESGTGLQHESIAGNVSTPEKVAANGKPAEDTSEEDNGGHSTSGAICKCGQIHVRRGDRVRRGPAPMNDYEESVAVGDLGTIVRVGPRQETVLVKWDRSPTAFSYVWPDPGGDVVAPAGFKDIACDVAKVQNCTGLSCIAAEEILRCAKFDVQEVLDAVGKARVKETGDVGKIVTHDPRDQALSWKLQFSDRSDWFSADEVVPLVEQCEDKLRKSPELFHQVRILPESLTVQDMFDAIRPCDCGAERCAGGLQWSSRADKHLGREAVVLKRDEKDDTFLVETVGPCECKIWYPRLALQPVFNPDLEDKPAFKAGERAECRMDNGWLLGSVNEVLWDGPNRTGPVPYTVTLDDGRSIYVPNANLIRRPAGNL